MTPRLFWILTVAMLLGVGVGVVWWPAAERIAAIQSQAKELYDQANANEAQVRRAALLRSALRRISDDVRTLSGARSASAETANALDVLDRAAHRDGVEVRAIVPAPAALPSPSAALTGQPLEVDVRGRFRNVLAFASELPRHDVLIDVGDVSLSQRGDRSPKPVLDAKIDLIVYRYRDPAERLSQHAPSSL